MMGFTNENIGPIGADGFQLHSLKHFFWVRHGAPNYLHYHHTLNTLLRDCSLLREE